MIKLVILDFYGVLYSNFNWDEIDRRISQDEGKAQKFAHLKNLSNKGKLVNLDFRNEVAKLAQDHKHADKPAGLKSPHINGELIGIIRRLMPEAELALLSNGNRDDVVSQLRECGMVDDFEYIFTSSDMDFIKPQIGAYKKVFSAADVNHEEAVIIDDSPNHNAATESYGFNTIRFLGNDDLVEQLSSYKNT